MAKTFMDDNFLLGNETARHLYDSAKNEPIYDYHCHLSPSAIADNISQKNLTDAWLSSDHYKWRMMRAMGIEEEYITGGASGFEKFNAWARTVENLIGNPLYHWTHLELQRYFGIYEPLTEGTAPLIWEKANTMLEKPELTVKNILEKFKIHTIGTTDDPIDSLEHHRMISDGTAQIGKTDTKVIPTFRPDRALNIDAAGFAGYIEELSRVSGLTIQTYSDVIEALEKRLDFFISLGCCSSDHGLEYVPFTIASGKKIEKTFNRAIAGKPVSKEDADAYKTSMLTLMAILYAQRGIVMQLHLSSTRNISAKQYFYTGANTGFDAVNDCELSIKLAALLDCMESRADRNSGLPKTIFYSSNPKDYYPLATIMNGFQGTGIIGKMQLGSAWWFCDHKDGIEEQMRILANLGVLPGFVGMLTDSRSFLSYPRHEYFRRIMCNLIGGWAENGEFPLDMQRLKKIVCGISFGNAKNYFER